MENRTDFIHRCTLKTTLSCSESQSDWFISNKYFFFIKRHFQQFYLKIWSLLSNRFKSQIRPISVTSLNIWHYLSTIGEIFMHRNLYCSRLNRILLATFISEKSRYWCNEVGYCYFMSCSQYCLLLSFYFMLFVLLLYICI